MAVDTRVSPYFDDFDENKNYVRVLYKPGVAVQARELTQSQTILQNQIKTVGNFLFKDGSKVKGPKPIVNINARTIRLKPNDSTGTPIELSNFLNTFVTTDNSEVIGVVDFVFEADDPNVGDPPSLVISLKRYDNINDGMFEQNTILNFYNDYTEAILKSSPNFNAVTADDVTKNASTTLSAFSKTATLDNPSTLLEVGDLLVHPRLKKKVYVVAVISTTQVELSEPPDVTIGSENISYVTKATCPTCIFTQDDAVFYKSGFFVKSTNQSIVPDKRTSLPTKLMAFLSDQQVITSEDDPSLLDPALESSNYFATGADRLKIDLNLSSLDVVDGQANEDSENLIPLLYFNRGKIEYIVELSDDAELDRKLAERTYDESGSYVVAPFQITPDHSLESNNVLIFNVSAGKAYVGGLIVRTVDTTRLEISKPTTTETKTNYNINTTYGNYFRVAGVRNSLTNPADLEASSMFLELHNVTNPTNANTLVGTIAFKNLEYDTLIGGDSPEYKLFYHSYSPEREVPATWDLWSVKYGISTSDGQYIANVLYTNNNLLGNYGPAKTPYYGLFREPDTGGVAFWYRRWVTVGKNIDTIKQEFALAIPTTSSDYSRVTSNVKSFAQVINNSVFYDGLVNVKKIKSIVGVSNPLTNQGTTATYSAPFFYANISSSGINTTTGDTIIFDRDRATDSLIYPLNKSYVKTVDRIQTFYNKVIKNAVFGAGAYTRSLSSPETFALGDGVIPPSTARTNFTVMVKSGATSNVKLGAFNFERGSVTISGDSSTLTIDTGDPGFTGLADISLTIENDAVEPRTKTLVSGFAKLVDIQKSDLKYSLGKADIISFGGVHKLANLSIYSGEWGAGPSYSYENIVSFKGSLYKAIIPSTGVSPEFSNAWIIVEKEPPGDYFLDNGQRDHFYDHGSITHIGSSLPPGNVVVTFNYYTHSGEGPAVVQSYPSDSYARIPVYRSVIDAKEYVLRDCIDFRPRRVDDSNYQDFAATIIPNSSITTEADVTYYVGRRDRIYVTNNLQNYNSPYNKFYVELGKETANPGQTPDNSDLTKLTIATLDIPPYTVDAFDVRIVYEDNKRFTMRDIAKIESLTLDLDKAVKLQSIEIASLKATVTNDTGDSLLKSGILVENFKDFNTADLGSGYFTVAVDTESEECFPTFGAWNIDLGIIEDTDIFMFNDIITKKYTEELYVSNLEANNEIFVNPGGIDDGKGRAELSKKNSFRVNTLLTGGLLLGGYIAYKTAYALAAKATFSAAVAGYTDYALIAAYQGESTLAVAWGAVKELGYSVLQSLSTIDGILETVSWPYKALKVGAQWIYNTVTGQGASSVLPTSWSVSSVGEAVFGESAWGAFSEGSRLVGNALSNIFKQPIGATVGELQTGFGFMTSAAVSYTWGNAALGASKIASLTSNVPILSSVTGAIATGLNTAYAWILGAGPLVQIAAVAAIVYVGAKVVKAVWNGVKKVFSFLSDIRTKENVTFKRKLPNGLNLYEFEYKKEFKDQAGHGRYEGFMAHEVEKLYPNAVKVESSGYKSINYSLIGI
jgi:hypothetical protein